MKAAELIRILEQQAAQTYACDWDNVGLLVGSMEKEVKKVYLALDATDEAVKEAIAAGADFLLTHHPLLFRGVKRVTDGDFIGRRIIAMVRTGMSYYAMHTNFDVAVMGSLAAKKLGIQVRAPLEVTCVEDGIARGIGAAGEFAEPISLAECCRRVKDAFALEHVTVFGELSSTVRCAAVCPGSGKSTLDQALAAGADVYITGDIDHHTGIDAVACGMAVIDAGHYGLEHIFIPYMEQYLREHAPGLTVLTQGRADPFQIV